MPYLTQTEINEMPPAAQQIYADMMRRSALYSDDSQYDPKYSGDRIAPITDDINLAHQNIRHGGKEFEEMKLAQDQINRSLMPFHENYQQYMNPYQQAVIQQLTEEGSRNFNENILPALDSRFLRLGQFGSTKHADLALRAARDFQKELFSKQQQSLHSGYEKSSDIYNSQQNRNIDAAMHYANVANAKQGARLADANALENIGRYKQQQNQSVLDVQYQEYLRQLDEPMRRLQAQSSILQGIPNFSSSSTQYRETPTTAPIHAPNIGNIANSLLAARLMGGQR